MNVKRKNGNTWNKAGWIRNTLFGKAVDVHLAFSINSNRADNTAPCLFDENTRKSVDAACLEAERWRAVAGKLRLNLS